MALTQCFSPALGQSSTGLDRWFRDLAKKTSGNEPRRALGSTIKLIERGFFPPSWDPTLFLPFRLFEEFEEFLGFFAFFDDDHFLVA